MCSEACAQLAGAQELRRESPPPVRTEQAKQRSTLTKILPKLTKNGKHGVEQLPQPHCYTDPMKAV